MSAGLDPTEVDGTGKTPATTACTFGQSQCLELLIRGGIDVTVEDGTGKTPVGIAFHQNQGECMCKLIHANLRMSDFKVQVTSVGNEVEVVIYKR